MDAELIKDQLIKAKHALNSAKKTYYSQHLYEFNRDILGWPDLYEPLHKQVCDFVQDHYKKKKLLMLLPRGSFKSSVITVGFSLWQIAKNPNTRILISNATYPMAVSFLSQIKKHITSNETFKNVFGDMYIPSETWREDRISVSKENVMHKEPTIWAFGSGGNLVGSHFNIAILDDVVARETIGTKDQIEKTKNFFKDVLDLVDPMPSGHKIIIVIGTTWHFDDLYSWIQDKKNNLLPGFEVMRLPAFEGEWDTGKLLFPTRLNWPTLRKLNNEQGNAHFSAQYLLNPIATADQVFKGPFKTYEETDLRGVELTKFFAVDPAISEKQYADYSAMVCVGVDKDNSWYVLDIWREQCQPSKLIEQMFYWDEKWKPVSIGLETSAFQKVLQYQLNDEMKKRNRFLPIKELKHAGMFSDSKDQRIRSLQPRYEVGNIFHPHIQSVPLVEYLEDELMRFPKNAHDDIIDSMASLNELAFPPRAREQRKTFKQQHYPA